MNNYDWLGFFEILIDHDDEIELEVSLNLKHPKGNEMVTKINGFIIYLNEDLTSRVISLLKGFKWRKEERHEVKSAKRGFFLANEKPKEDRIRLGGKSFHTNGMI